VEEKIISHIQFKDGNYSGNPNNINFLYLNGGTIWKIWARKIAGQLLSGIILGPLLLNLIKPQDIFSIKDLAIFFYNSLHRHRSHNGSF